MRFLAMLDELLRHAETSQWPILYKSVADIRVQALLDLEHILKKTELPSVAELDE